MRMPMEEIEVRLMNHLQVDEVAEVASLSFSGMKDPEKSWRWISCNFNAFPRCQYFVAEGRKSGRVYGYVFWMEKGGFREEAVWELEQIAVHPDYRGFGIGTRLVKDSLRVIIEQLHKRGSKLKLAEVSTGTANEAQRLYEKTLGAKVVMVIPDLYRQDEVVMMARGLDERQSGS